MSQKACTASTDAITPADSLAWDKQDTVWMLSLYGTAIGAGTLFLPIEAGMNGILPLLVMLILALPMTYYSHRALCRFVLSSTSKQDDITAVAEQHFGLFAGKIITCLYFFAIFPILLMYSVAITNTAESFIVYQLGWGTPPRALLAMALLLALMSIIRFGQQAIVRSMSFLVYPFVTVLMALAIYLIPHWNAAIFAYELPHNGQGIVGLFKSIWLLIPVMIFSFNHSPIISSFAVKQKQRYDKLAETNATRILKYSHCLMVGTVMFFVLSCVFSLSPQDLALAKQENISILSYLANHFNNPIIAYVAPFIALIAISKSFLGHYLGAKEGLHSLMTKTMQDTALCKKIPLNTLIDVLILVSCCAVAILNPNILGMIESLGGPIIAVILFLMPMYAIAKVPAMKKYRQKLPDRFVLVIGLIAISAIMYGVLDTLLGN